MTYGRISLDLDGELVQRALRKGGMGKTEVEVVEDALAVYLGLQALDEARAQGGLSPEEADSLALAEVRAVRAAKTSRTA